MSYETKDGKVIKLPKTMTNYAIEITRDGKTTEIVVGPEGAVVVPAKWSGTKEE